MVAGTGWLGVPELFRVGQQAAEMPDIGGYPLHGQRIAGPPGSIFPIGTTTMTCSATDSDDAGPPVSTSFSVQVNALLTVVTTSVPTARVNTSYSTTLQASGGGPVHVGPGAGQRAVARGLVLSPSG